MVELIKSKMKLRADSSSCIEYENCICDLIQNETVLSMNNFIQHSNITCLEHSIDVSYKSYLVCRGFELDYKSAARGALLHDFFLYDWHITKSGHGLHGFTHPGTALKNANEKFCLNAIEKDIIEKHMWPLTVRLPKYKESFIVSFIDKYCSTAEIIELRDRNNSDRFIRKLLSRGNRETYEL